MNSQDVIELRSALDVSRSVLARFLGVSEVTVIRWESSGSRGPAPKGLPLVILDALRRSVGCAGIEFARGVLRSYPVNHGRALLTLLEAVYKAETEQSPKQCAYCPGPGEFCCADCGIDGRKVLLCGLKACLDKHDYLCPSEVNGWKRRSSPAKASLGFWFILETDGIQLVVYPEDFIQGPPPKPGDIVQFSYREENGVWSVRALRVVQLHGGAA